MKTFSVAVAVAVVLTFICLQESSAVAEVQELEGPMMDYNEMPMESWKMLDNNRKKRSPAGCEFCCGCCPFMRGCGLCCQWRFLSEAKENPASQ